MKKSQRKAIAVKHASGLTPEAIAAALGVPVALVHAALAIKAEPAATAAPKTDEPRSLAAQAQALAVQGLNDEAIADKLKLSVGHVIDLIRPTLKSHGNTKFYGGSFATVGGGEKRRL